MARNENLPFNGSTYQAKAYKGPFATIAKLRSDFKIAESGDFAFIEDTESFVYWNKNLKDWKNGNSISSNGVTPVLTDAYTANGIDDGNGNITGTTTFQLPLDVNTSYPIECIDGGLINLAFTVNPTTKLATFTTAPLSGSIYFKYYK